MKFPTLSRIPRHKRFHYEPRYYDPIKEDIENRTSRIRKELGIAGQNENGAKPSHIRGSFTRKTIAKNHYNRGSGLLQFIIFLILGGLFAGYLYYGNDILYVFFIFVPIYIYFRAKKLFKSN